MTDQGFQKLADDLQQIDAIYRKNAQTETVDDALAMILSELCTQPSHVHDQPLSAIADTSIARP